MAIIIMAAITLFSQFPLIKPLATAQTPVPALPKAAAPELWRSSDLTRPSLTDGWDVSETLRPASAVLLKAVYRPWFGEYGQQ